MEDHKRNSITGDGTSKRDKKLQQISNRLSKLDSTFNIDKDNFYRSILYDLQNSLIALQKGTNPEFLEKKERLEEERDYELTRLRLWEEYQVKRVEEEYQNDIHKAQENHDKMIKLMKEKLYDKLQKQIKQLKEDKLLLNLVNARSWSHNGQNYSTVSALNAAATALNVQDRRSLRKREIHSRFTPGEVEDLSDGGISGVFESDGYRSSGKRRRHYATRYSSNDEMTSGVTSGNAHRSHNHQNGFSSGNDSNLSDKDYDALNKLIMNNNENGASFNFDKSVGSSSRSSRSSTKQFTELQGLKSEELNEDLTLLRNAVSKKKGVDKGLT